jgi:hypothetical protein
VNHIFYGEPRPYRESLSNVRVIIAIVCALGGVVVSGGDGTNSSTRVLVARRAWAHVIISCLV